MFKSAPSMRSASAVMHVAALRVVGMLETVHKPIKRELVESSMLAQTHPSTLGADRRILSSGPGWTT